MKYFSSLCSSILLVVALFPTGNSVQVNSWLTTADDTTGAMLKLLEPQDPIDTTGTTSGHLAADLKFSIDVSQSQQKILGYGAGLPQSSASVLYSLKEKSVSLYNSVMEQLFTTTNDGAGINILRFPIGSCDFSIHNTSYDEHKDDYALEYFAIDDDSQMIVSVLKDALAVNPKLVLIGN